jgi:hypothetical protein
MLINNEQANCLTGTTHTVGELELMVNIKNTEASKLSCHGASVSSSGRLNDLANKGQKVRIFTMLTTYMFNAASLVTNQITSPTSAPTIPILSGTSKYIFLFLNANRQTSIEEARPTAVKGTTCQTCSLISEASCEIFMMTKMKNVATLAVTLRCATSRTYHVALIAKIIPDITPLIADTFMLA